MEYITLSLLFMLWGLLIGIHEGMIMIQIGDPMCTYSTNLYLYGVRSHYWFRVYHIINRLHYVPCIIITTLFVKYHQYLGLLNLIGMLCFMWLFISIGINITRYKKILTKHEHFTFGDLFSIKIKSPDVLPFQLCKILLGLIFIYLGGIK